MFPANKDAYYFPDDPDYWCQSRRSISHPPFTIPDIKDFCPYDSTKICYDQCLCQECGAYQAYMRRQPFAKNGAYVHMTPHKINKKTSIVESCTVQPEVKDKIDVKNDILMNVKQDESGKFKVRLMSAGVSEIVVDEGIDIDVTREITKEISVEVIKEVPVSVDTTDEVQREQLQALKSINSQLSGMSDEIRYAKYQDVLTGIQSQLSGMSFDIKQAKYQDILSSISHQLSELQNDVKVPKYENALSCISHQLNGIQNDVKVAKYQDVLSSILMQLSSMTYLSSMSEIKGQLNSVIANNHAVRVING